MDQALLNEAKVLAARGYQVQVQKEDGEDGRPVWVAYVPEMPSCVALGDSTESAKEALKIVREDYIYFRLKRGVFVPDPKRVTRDATIKIKVYEHRGQTSSTMASDAVGNRLRTRSQSNAFTRQPAAALISQTVSQRNR